MAEGETNAERVRAEFKKNNSEITSKSEMVDRSMIQMDDRANYVTLDGDQACAMIALMEIHNARKAWYNRDPSNPANWVTITKANGDTEKRFIELDYSADMLHDREFAKSLQITVDSFSRKQHLHMTDNLKPIEQTDEVSKGWLSFLQKK